MYNKISYLERGTLIDTLRPAEIKPEGLQKCHWSTESSCGLQSMALICEHWAYFEMLKLSNS